LLERLEGAHEKFIDRVALVQTSRKPYVVKYVVDALREDNEGEDPLTLTDDQKGFLFLLLKTVIDVLDQKGEVIKFSMAFLPILASSKSDFPYIFLPEVNG
jgi:hypothetical protein